MSTPIISGFQVHVLCVCGKGEVRLTPVSNLYLDVFCGSCGRVYTAEVQIAEHPTARRAVTEQTDTTPTEQP